MRSPSHGAHPGPLAVILGPDLSLICIAPLVIQALAALPSEQVDEDGYTFPLQDMGGQLKDIWCLSPYERKAKRFERSDFTFAGETACEVHYTPEILLTDFEITVEQPQSDVFQSDELGKQSRCRCPCGCPHRPRKGNVWHCEDCGHKCCQSCIGWNGAWRRCCLCRRAPPPQPPPRPPSTHERNQIDRAVRPLESYQIGICASIRRTEKARSYVVDSGLRGVEQRRQDFGDGDATPQSRSNA